MGGYWSRGSVRIESPPASMMMSAMIGRSMKNLAMLLRLSRLDRRLDGAHENSRLRFLHPRHDHPLAFVQSALHHPLVAQGPGRLDDARGDLVVRTHHERGGLPLRVARDSDLRHEYRGVVDALLHARAHEHTGKEHMVAI